MIAAGPTEIPERVVPPARTSAWLDWAAPAAILLLAAAMRLAGLDKSLWLDEAGSLAQAGAADFIATARDYDHPPLYFALLRAGLQMTPSFPVLRLFSVACGVGAVAVFCFFFGGRERLAGWTAALLLAVLPGFVFNSQELRQYGLLSLAFSVALALAWRVERAPHAVRFLAGLATALAVAASTHLITVFFMAALIAVMAWRLRRERPGILLRVSCAFVPATLLVLFFKYVFLLRTVKSPDLWWMPPVSPALLRQVFIEDTGWSALVWFYEACERHVPGVGSVFLVAAGLGAAFVAWTAWARRGAGPAHALLAIGLVYWGLLTGYSLVAPPIVWPRTMLPGMLPFVLSLGLGVATHPRERQRRMATAVLTVLAIAMTVPWLRGLAFQPAEDLRGFSRALSQSATPPDLLVLVNGVEIGLEPYWPAYKKQACLKVELRDPLPATLAALTAARGRQPEGGAIFLVYRADSSLAPKRAVLQAIVDETSVVNGPPEQLWDKSTYHVLRFNPTPARQIR